MGRQREGMGRKDTGRCEGAFSQSQVGVGTREVLEAVGGG